MRPLSDMLSDMSVRAKTAEDNAAAARKESHEQLEARIAKVKADAQKHGTAAKAQADQASKEVSNRWTALQAGVRENVDKIHRDLDERREKHDAKAAQRRADRAEENAMAAVDFALYAIDAADEAVLEAIDARVVADASVA